MVIDIRLRSARENERSALGALKLRASLAWGDFVEELSALPEAGELAANLVSGTFVAESEEGVVGFASLVVDDSKRAELEELFVDPFAWRNGVGRKLVEEAARRARGAGADAVHVVASRRSRRFYEASGFRFLAEVMTQFEPAPHMVLVWPKPFIG